MYILVRHFFGDYGRLLMQIVEVVVHHAPSPKGNVECQIPMDTDKNPLNDLRVCI